MTRITITKDAMTKLEALTKTTGSATMTDELSLTILRYRQSRIEQLTAERDRLREALTDAWDAHNKHGDQMSGWWVHDDALKGESHE